MVNLWLSVSKWSYNVCVGIFRGIFRYIQWYIQCDECIAMCSCNGRAVGHVGGLNNAASTTAIVICATWCMKPAARKKRLMPCEDSTRNRCCVTYCKTKTFVRGREGKQYPLYGSHGFVHYMVRGVDVTKAKPEEMRDFYLKGRFV